MPLLLFATNLLEVSQVEYYISHYSNYIVSIAGDGLSKFIFNQPILPLGIFLRGIYALISPFPNFFGLFKETSKVLYDIIQIFIYIGVIIQIFTIPFIIKRVLRFDWLSLAFLSWFLAVIVTTFTFRHFIFYYPFLSAVAIDGYFSTKQNTRKIILFLWIIVSVGLGMIYISLKMLI